MSYLVFARKWRPKDFEEVVGQEHVTRTLKNAVRTGKLGQAYLFAGPQGVGKTSCARILAKALNCEKGPTDEPCGVCGACRDIAEGRSLDVIEIDGASNRGIDEIRALRENVKFSPLTGKSKIYIIDEVHMLTAEAFNALLKTLEEPPPFVRFVFATTHPDKVLPTILSRCQRFDFVRLPAAKIVAKLEEIAASEKLSLPQDALFAIARAADGSLRDAESILDQVASFSSGTIRLDDIIAVLGVIEHKVFFDFVEAVTAGDAAAALRQVAAVVDRGKDLDSFLDGLLEYYRDLMVLRAAPEDAALIELAADEQERVRRQAQALSLGHILTSLGHLFVAQDMARRLHSARIALDVLAVKLSQLAQKHPAGHSAAATPQGSASASPQGGAEVSPKGEEDTPKKGSRSHFAVLKEEKGAADASLTSFEEPRCTLEGILEAWGRVNRIVSEKKMSLATYLKHGRPVKLEGDQLTLGFPRRSVFFKEALAHKDNLEILSKALVEACGARLRIRCDIVEEAEIPEEEPPAPEAPIVKSALDLFKGKVIS
ncbi:MAG: DNA polymerase III subunit gamma/tau [Deltaproteobacteria bacterium]